MELNYFKSLLSSALFFEIHLCVHVKFPEDGVPADTSTFKSVTFRYRVYTKTELEPYFILLDLLHYLKDHFHSFIKTSKPHEYLTVIVQDLNALLYFHT